MSRLSYRELLNMSVSALLENRLRSGITVSIIALGITALVGILTSLDGLADSLQNNLSNLGAHSFTILNRKGARFGGGQREGENYPPIRYREAERFVRQYSGPGDVAYLFTATGQAQVGYRKAESNPNVEVKGVDGAYLSTAGLDLQQGRTFSRTEQKLGPSVAILGYELQTTLFGAVPATGRWCTVDGRKYKVVGVLAPKGSAIGRSADRSVLLPARTARRQYAQASRKSFQISVQAPNVPTMDAAVNAARGRFRLIRGLAPGTANNFSIQRSDSLTSTLVENLQYVRYVAVVIGLITLAGAAIGLLNIMLVSVTERTREIGVRKALGAPRRAIKQQFLVESVIVSQAGGLVGMLTGLLMGNLVSAALDGPFVIPWAWLAGAVVLCLGVGTAAGFYPAAKASRLDPIESLRFE